MFAREPPLAEASFPYYSAAQKLCGAPHNFDFQFNPKMNRSLVFDMAASAMLDRLLYHGHALKCGPRCWRGFPNGMPRTPPAAAEG
jgi:hypothetical protein